MKVLLVEDDAAVSNICKLLLQHNGHEVTVLSNLPTKEEGGKIEVDFESLTETARAHDAIIWDGRMHAGLLTKYADFAYMVERGELILPSYYTKMNDSFQTGKGIIKKVGEDFKGLMISWSSDPKSRAEQIESGCTYPIALKNGMQLAELLSRLDESKKLPVAA